MKNALNSASMSVIARAIDNDEGSNETETEVDFDAIREAFKDAKGREVKVSNKILGMAIANNPEFENYDEEQTYAFIEKVEEAANRVAIADPGIGRLIEKIDDAFNTEIAECLDAVVKSKTTAVDVYAQLHRVYSKDELDGMPFAGSDEKSVAGTNYRPDKIKTKDRVTGVEMTVTWLNDYVSATPWGKAFETDLDEVSKELKTAGSTSNPKFKNKGRKFLLNQKAILTQKRNALRSMFKRAINLHHQFEAVNAMPLVHIEWMEGTQKDGIWLPIKFGDGKQNTKDGIWVSKSPKPLWIYPKGKASDGRDISVTQLVNFDVQAALVAENNGTMGDLIDTLSKGSDEPDVSGDGSGMPQEEALTTQQRWVNYMNNKENRANLRRILADKKNDERKDLLENIFAEFHLILPIVRAYKDEYETLTGEKPPAEIVGLAKASVA